MKQVYYFLLLVLGCGFYFSCADDTEVGSGLLGSQDIEVLFKDDFDLTMRQIAPEPFIQTFSLLHSLGTLESDIFGSSSSSFYIRPILNSFSTLPDFGFGTFDSVVVALKFDRENFYGDPRAFFDIDVLELTESIDDVDSILTDQIFSVNPEPLGSLRRLVPGDLDSILVYSTTGDTTYFQDVITIPLGRRFGAEIFLDTLNNRNALGFSTLLNGFLIQSTSNNSLLRMNLTDEISSLLFYYRDSSGVAANFPYRFSTQTPLNFTNDISSSRVQNSIDNPDQSDLFYLQGHAGSTIEIDIEDIMAVTDPFVNFASLEVSVEKNGLIDTSLFGIPEALSLFTVDADGTTLPVQDLQLGLINNQTNVIFDGEADIDLSMDIVTYEMNITAHIKQVLDGLQPTKLYLRVRNRVQTPNALVIYGPNHPTYPTRLKLTYTKS